MLNLLISIRGAINIAFGVLLFCNEEIAQGFVLIAKFGLLDGLLGGLMAAVMIHFAVKPLLILIAMADALSRFFIGSLLFFNPGLENSFLGSVFFMTSTILLCFIVGCGSTIGLLITRITEKNSQQNYPFFGLSIALGMMTCLLGVALYCSTSDEDRRMAASCFAIATGSMLLYLGAQKNLF